MISYCLDEGLYKPFKLLMIDRQHISPLFNWDQWKSYLDRSLGFVSNVGKEVSNANNAFGVKKTN